jgi:hypothetical protein
MHAEFVPTPRVHKAYTVDMHALPAGSRGKPLPIMRRLVRRWEEAHKFPRLVVQLVRTRDARRNAHRVLFHAERDLICGVVACVGVIRCDNDEQIFAMAQHGRLRPCCLDLDGRRYTVVPSLQGGDEYGATLIVDDAATGERIAIGHGQHSDECVLDAVY